MIVKSAMNHPVGRVIPGASPSDRRSGVPAGCRHAFTLIELLVVIAIIGIVAAISVPAFNNMRKSDAAAAATRQLQDDLARARQFAISRRTTVYMVFVPANYWNDPAFTALNGTFTAEDRFAATNLMDKQLIGYNFVALRDVGEQPGRGRPRYLDEWRTLPEGTFVPTYKFSARNFITPVQGYLIPGMSVTNIIPFPRADTISPSGFYPWVPYIAFNHLGQLESGLDVEAIPLARGTVTLPLDANKKPYPGLPVFAEKPPGNSTNSAYTLVMVDRLTGRAHVERQKIQ